MTDENEEYVRNKQPSTGTVVDVTAGPPEALSGNKAPVVSDEAVHVSGGGTASDMDTVSRFGTLD